MKIKALARINGEIDIPGDKSISHRAIMFGALSSGTTVIHNFLQGADCLSTIGCFRALGIDIKNDEKTSSVTVHGKGLHGLKKPETTLDVGNSGTTLRLISGILSGQNFSATLTGDASIQKRPMQRVITPLSSMGADLKSLKGNACAPIIINEHNVTPCLRGISYTQKIASAQVKSAILLAGLYADGTTSVTEPYLSRNHTELMLRQFGGSVTTEGTTTSVTGGQSLKGTVVNVPGDISSAAYFMVAALILPDSELILRNVGINKTRDGIIEVLRAMGGDITELNKKETDGEPVCDLKVKSSELSGTVISGSLIPRLIDEIPVLAVAACYASGQTVIKDAQELKVKESNRIDEMVNQLKKMGADITATEDGMIINGGSPLTGTVIDSKEDHRIAMSFAIAALKASGITTILNESCVNISFPGFYDYIKDAIVL